MDIQECVDSAKAIQTSLAQMGVKITQMQVDLAATVACLEECAADMAEMEAQMAANDTMQMSFKPEDLAEMREKIKKVLQG